MIELVLTACLIGGQCKEIKLSYSDEGQFSTPYACMVGAQVEIAKWLEGHPKYIVQRWTCRQAKSEADL